MTSNPISNSRELEDNVVKQQRLAFDLTTYNVYPFPGRLIPIPYPVDNKMKPVPPCCLQEHSRTHRFNLPTCFHGKQVKVVVDDSDGGRGCIVTMVCATDAVGELPCLFRINVTTLLLEESCMELCRYGLRSGYTESLSSPARPGSNAETFGRRSRASPQGSDTEIRFSSLPMPLTRFWDEIPVVPTPLPSSFIVFEAQQGLEEGTEEPEEEAEELAESVGTRSGSAGPIMPHESADTGGFVVC